MRKREDWKILPGYIFEESIAVDVEQNKCCKNDIYILTKKNIQGRNALYMCQCSCGKMRGKDCKNPNAAIDSFCVHPYSASAFSVQNKVKFILNDYQELVVDSLPDIPDTMEDAKKWLDEMNSLSNTWYERYKDNSMRVFALNLNTLFIIELEKEYNAAFRTPN